MPVRAIILVAAADQAAANAAAAEIDTVGGEFTFTVPLENTDGNLVAYACNWQFDDTRSQTGAERRDALLASFSRRGIASRAVRDDYAEPDPAKDNGRFDRLLTARNLRRRQAAVES